MPSSHNPAPRAGASRSPEPDPARERILRAAVHHFSQSGLAGGRTDAIAEAAQVNKALLYYYFKNKHHLYAAALEDAARQVAAHSIAALDAGLSPGESLLRLVLNHFDRLAGQHEFQSLMQHEMVRHRRGESDVLPVLARTLYGPLLKRMHAIAREGMREGELVKSDWLQILYAALGANVFYFLSAPVMQMALHADPLSQPNLRARRRAMLGFLGQALFEDRRHGARVARHVLASAPLAGALRARTEFRAEPVQRTTKGRVKGNPPNAEPKRERP